MRTEKEIRDRIDELVKEFTEVTKYRRMEIAAVVKELRWIVEDEFNEEKRQ